MHVKFALAALAVAAGLLWRSAGVAAAPPPMLSHEALAPIAGIVNQEIAAGRVPGAVVLIGQGDEVVYREAFGVRTKAPALTPMTLDTVFDLASVTKVIATTTAVMQLVERGALRLDAPAATYWPAFGAGGKRAITIRDLMTHYSGLRPDVSLRKPWLGYRSAMNLLVAERPVHAIGTEYVYSDENFEVLGEIVRRVSGQPLDRYGARRIFMPLGMSDTGFHLSSTQVSRLAPTMESQMQASGLPDVVVNDPTAQRMGGIAGHAGLFSTADDLGVFAAMLLDGGTFHGARVLRRDSVALMTRPASPPSASRPRGLGWDLGDPFLPSSDGAPLALSYGHTGYTGTMLWIDPVSKTYVIVLSNRTYPDGRGDAQPLRKAIIDQVSAALKSGVVSAAAAAPVASAADADRRRSSSSRP